MKRKICNDNFFDEINSEEQAYLLGFFLADGCITMNSNCINSYQLAVALNCDDSYILNWYKKYICPENNIIITNYKKGAKNRKDVFRIKWTSNHMKETMSKYHILQKKTYDIDFSFPFEYIPKQYLWDFIRGFFDGDGQFSYNKNTHCSTFALYTTSLNFASQLGEIFEKNFNVKTRIDEVKKSNMILYTLRFHSGYNKKEFIKNLYMKFYYNKKLYMNRKQQNILNYLLFKYRDNQQDCERLVDIVERRD